MKTVAAIQKLTVPQLQRLVSDLQVKLARHEVEKNGVFGPEIECKARTQLSKTIQVRQEIWHRNRKPNK